MNVLEMDSEALELTGRELADKIEALPQRFTMNGFEFIWREKMDFQFSTGEDGNLRTTEIVTLNILGHNGDSRDMSIDIIADGAVKYYSFYSNSGNNNSDAEESQKYFQTCSELLSLNFRNKVIKDYQGKLESLNELKSEYKAISNELKRRHDEAEAEKKNREAREAGERRSRQESVGQVWFDYHSGSGCRYVVKNSTEKTITFAVWYYHDDEKEWRPASYDYTKRLSKHLLGQKPSRRYRRLDKETAVCPVGTDDLNSQKPEQPETVAY